MVLLDLQNKPILRIILPCALNTGHSGGYRGHFYDMTGMASGNAHWTVHSEGERGGTSDKVITAIGAASLRRGDHGEVLVVGIARGHTQHVYIFSGRVKFRLMNLPHTKVRE